MQCSPQHTDSAIPARSIATPIPSRRWIDPTDRCRTLASRYRVRPVRPTGFLASGRDHPASGQYADRAGEAMPGRRSVNSAQRSRLRPMTTLRLRRDSPSSVTCTACKTMPPAYRQRAERRSREAGLLLERAATSCSRGADSTPSCGNSTASDPIKPSRSCSLANATDLSPRLAKASTPSRTRSLRRPPAGVSACVAKRSMPQS